MNKIGLLVFKLNRKGSLFFLIIEIFLLQVAQIVTFA